LRVSAGRNWNPPFLKQKRRTKMHDVIIVGGGPAGLNAALVLARCRRKVVLFDTGKGRNIRSHGLHNYLTRDGILPTDFRKKALEEVKRYGVRIIHREVVQALHKGSNGFEVVDQKQERYPGRKLLIATGLRDNLPTVEGMGTYFGSSIFHCPYCDGWEVRDQKIGVYARNKNGTDLCLSLRNWSKDVTLFCDGRNYLKDQEKKLLNRLGVEIFTGKIRCVEGKNGKLKRVVFTNHETRDCDAIFFVNGYHQQSGLLRSIGCSINAKGVAITNRHQQTNIPGLYVAGDVARDMHFVVVAAAEGAKAGVAINKELQKESIF
jgi:thioredoxin reductase